MHLPGILTILPESYLEHLDYGNEKGENSHRMCGIKCDPIKGNESHVEEFQF